MANGEKDMSEEKQKELLNDGALTIDGAAEFAGVQRTFLYAKMGAGELPFTKCGRRRLIPKRALVEMLSKGLVAAGA
jgi:excisionase family DNA binding protein